MILDQIRGIDGSGIEKLNGKVRGTLLTALPSSIEDTERLRIVRNAACGDGSALALLSANPNTFFNRICGGGFTSLLKDYILRKNVLTADVNIYPIMAACLGGHTDIVRLLIHMVPDVNIQDVTGCTALMYACQWGHTDTARLLIDKGADLNLQSLVDGNTALMYVCVMSRIETVWLLVDKGVY